MTTTREERVAPRPWWGGGPWFYGWNVVAVTLVTQGVSTAVYGYAFGFFLKPIAAEYDASRAVVSLGPTLLMGAQALVSPAVGRWLDGGSPRASLLVGAALLGGGLVAMGSAAALWQLALAAVVLVAPGCAILGPLSATKLATSWFERRLGRALGISATGTSLGGLVIPPVLALLIARHDWHTALELFGVASFGLILPLVWLVVRDTPAERGLERDGLPAEAARTSASGSPGPAWTTRAVLRTRVFWVLVVVLGLTMGSLSGLMAHLVAYALDRGLEPAFTGVLMSCLAGAGLAGKLGFAAAADRLDRRLTLAASVACAMVAVVALSGSPGTGRFMLASVAMGLATGGLLPSWSALVADAFGAGAVGRVMGLSLMAKQPLILAAAPFAGTVHDVTGGYDLAFHAFLAILVVALIGAALLPAPAPRRGAAG